MPSSLVPSAARCDSTMRARATSSGLEMYVVVPYGPELMNALTWMLTKSRAPALLATSTRA